MNWNPIDKKWHRVRTRLRSMVEAMYRALSGEWLAQLRLKDHYAEKRRRSS
jgi:hypothetical protein